MWILFKLAHDRCRDVSYFCLKFCLEPKPNALTSKADQPFNPRQFSQACGSNCFFFYISYITFSALSQIGLSVFVNAWISVSSPVRLILMGIAGNLQQMKSAMPPWRCSDCLALPLSLWLTVITVIETSLIRRPSPSFCLEPCTATYLGLTTSELSPLSKVKCTGFQELTYS